MTKQKMIEMANTMDRAAAIIAEYLGGAGQTLKNVRAAAQSLRAEAEKQGREWEAWAIRSTADDSSQFNGMVTTTDIRPDSIPAFELMRASVTEILEGGK